MNRENIQKVRDRIASLPAKRFSMESYFGRRESSLRLAYDNYPEPGATNRDMLEGACNTCACIAGHTLIALTPDSKPPRDYARAAAKLLGLKPNLALRLFEPNNTDAWFIGRGRELSAVTKTQALRVLDHLIQTGEVDWSKA